MNLNALQQVNTQPPSWQRAAQALLERRKYRSGFRDFVDQVNPRYQWYRHCEVIAETVERIATGDLKRVMIFVPPRHSKSETISKLFTAYYLRKFPNRFVGLTSYSADLSYVLSRASQAYYVNSGGQLNAQAGAVKHWETLQGGGLWAAGVGGPITGKGFDLGLIDDPIKNAEEAASSTIREKQRDWYNSTFFTRAEPNAAIVIIQTRWHVDDLSGWLLSEEVEQPENWHVLNFPAIAEDSQLAIPDSCSTEQEWRSTGEALCPERFPIEKLRAIEQRIGSYFFNALYQQRPTQTEGQFFNVSKLEVVEAAPVDLRQCRGWDLAATAGRSDYSAAVRLGVDAKGIWYILDVVRGQWGPDDRDYHMLQTTQLDGPMVRVRIAQDPGQAGVDQVVRLTRLLAGYPVRSERVTGDKSVRAFGLASQINAGNVRLVRGSWNRAFIEELRQFPVGKNDDQVDAAADAFTELALANEFRQGKLIR